MCLWLRTKLLLWQKKPTTKQQILYSGPVGLTRQIISSSVNFTVGVGEGKEGYNNIQFIQGCRHKCPIIEALLSGHLVHHH